LSIRLRAWPDGSLIRFWFNRMLCKLLFELVIGEKQKKTAAAVVIMAVRIRIITRRLKKYFLFLI